MDEIAPARCFARLASTLLMELRLGRRSSKHTPMQASSAPEQVARAAKRILEVHKLGLKAAAQCLSHCLLSNAEDGLPILVGTTFHRLTEVEIGLEKRVFKFRQSGVVEREGGFCVHNSPLSWVLDGNIVKAERAKVP
jgi:hypothetical protein